MFMMGIALVCFEKGEKFCINPEHVVAVVGGDTKASGTLIIMENTNVIAGEKFETVVKKIRNASK
jgi:hypothetical protein